MFVRTYICAYVNVSASPLDFFVSCILYNCVPSNKLLIVVSVQCLFNLLAREVRSAVSQPRSLWALCVRPRACVVVCGNPIKIVHRHAVLLSSHVLVVVSSHVLVVVTSHDLVFSSH